jgi:hypothetical protein
MPNKTDNDFSRFADIPALEAERRKLQERRVDLLSKLEGTVTREDALERLKKAQGRGGDGLHCLEALEHFNSGKDPFRGVAGRGDASPVVLAVGTYMRSPAFAEALRPALEALPSAADVAGWRKELADIERWQERIAAEIALRELDAKTAELETARAQMLARRDAA